MIENKSGIEPVEFQVLVRPDVIEEKTAGGIIKPNMSHEREQWAQVKGTLVAKGDAAFGDPFSAEEREKLVPGARVYFQKYQGVLMEGADGVEYRLCTDKMIGAIVTNESALPNVVGRNRAGLDAA